jgi:DNA-binding response OmpR family regulator
MTGYEACRRMKELDHLKNVPVAFLTAKGQDEEVQSGIESGAVAYILKPFALDELTARVTSILTEAGVSP